MWKQNVSLLVVAAVLIVFPLVWHHGRDEVKFAGADDSANQMIEQMAPGYEPWFKPFWEPPSGEVASMLFALQAAIGSGVLFFGLGWMMGRSKEKSVSQNETEAWNSDLGLDSR